MKVYQQALAQIEDAIHKLNAKNRKISQQEQDKAFRACLEQYKQVEGNGKSIHG
ncbi:hypothetical protein IGI39_002350 [Enterococcus sp. AZ135]|uniref:hypothetical protein n=1 Tax=unclassified Enterococcus TaxID=2608891 RepID=UPI003F1E742B